MDHTATAAKLAYRSDEGPRDHPLYSQLIDAVALELHQLDDALGRLGVRLAPVSASPDTVDARAGNLVEAQPLYRTELEGRLGNLVELAARLHRNADLLIDGVRL